MPKAKLIVKEKVEFQDGTIAEMKLWKVPKTEDKPHGYKYSFAYIRHGKRVEVLHVIKKERPASVYELAKMLNRDAKNVTQDLEYLKNIGLVEIKRTREKKERTIPEVKYDRIDLQIAV